MEIKKTHKDVVFDVLKSLGNDAYTTRDIMAVMTAPELFMVHNSSIYVSKALQRLAESGLIEATEKIKVGGTIMSKWKVLDKPRIVEKPQKIKDEISTDKSLVDPISESITQETDTNFKDKSEEKPINKSIDINQANTIEALIESANTVLATSVFNVFDKLTTAVRSQQSQLSHSQILNIDELINGLYETGDLLNEKIAVKNIIPVIEFLRGLK